MEASKLQQGQNYVMSVVRQLFTSGAYQATMYVSPTLTVTATRAVNMKARKLYGSRTTREGLTLTIGAPNYLQRAFIRMCKKAGQSFPVRKIQLRAIPAKRPEVSRPRKK